MDGCVESAAGLTRNERGDHGHAAHHSSKVSDRWLLSDSTFGDHASLISMLIFFVLYFLSVVLHASMLMPCFCVVVNGK